MKYCSCFRFLMGRRFTRLKRLCGNIGKNAICTYGKCVKIKKIKTGLNILCIISAKKVWLKILEKIMECLLNSLLRAKNFFTNCGGEKNKLPQEFISQMHKLNLLSYVEIFTISKTGSLKKFKT